MKDEETAGLEAKIDSLRRNAQAVEATPEAVLAAVKGNAGMSDASVTRHGRLHLRLPATSANLGSGFDAAAVALDFYLEIEAEPAAEFSIAGQRATMRSAAGGSKTT